MEGVLWLDQDERETAMLLVARQRQRMAPSPAERGLQDTPFDAPRPPSVPSKTGVHGSLVTPVRRASGSSPNQISYLFGESVLRTSQRVIRFFWTMPHSLHGRQGEYFVFISNIVLKY